MGINKPPIEYLEPERVCGIFDGDIPKPSARRNYARIYYFTLLDGELFEFDETGNYYDVDLNKLMKGQKICLIIERRVDRLDDLSLANIIKVEY